MSAVMGENFDTTLPNSDELKPIAVILLSPSVNLATGNFHGRFQALKLPMLAITGSDDNDPYAISSAAVRTAIWEYAPAGGKYLLLLQNAGHRLLAGSEMGGRFGQNIRRESTVSADERISSGQSGSGREGGRGSERLTTGGHSDSLRDGFWLEGDRRNPLLGYQHVAAILSASTAFLDAVVKNDQFAHFWLEDKANQWLGKGGSLKVR